MLYPQADRANGGMIVRCSMCGWSKPIRTGIGKPVPHDCDPARKTAWLKIQAAKARP